MGADRKLLIAAQGGLCAACGQPLELDRPLLKGGVDNPLRPSVDHVLAKSRGGRDNMTNKLAMHAICNSRKGSRAPNGCEMIFLVMVLAKLGVRYQDAKALRPLHEARVRRMIERLAA